MSFHSFWSRLHPVVGLRNDLRFAVRSLRKPILLSATVVVTLGFGLGLNTGVFTLINAALFRPYVDTGIFWYWCGRSLERRLKRMDEMHKSPGIVVLILNGVGLICAFALLVSLLWAGPGASGLILFVSTVAWCAAFVAYFGSTLANHIVTHRRTVQKGIRPD